MRLDSDTRQKAQKHSFFLWRTALTIVCATLAVSGTVYAQSPGPVDEALELPNVSPIPPAVQAPRTAPERSMPQRTMLGKDEMTILRDNYAGKYNPATIENLANLYWRLGAFDFDDRMAITNYTKITDCKIYTEYVNDDLEWTKIVDAMRDHLKTNSPSYPLNFQFLIKLHLGRYDSVRGGFPLVNRTGFIDANRIEVDSINHESEICYDKTVLEDYPRSLFLLLPQAFTLDFVKLDEHVAQAFILRKKAEYDRIPESKRVDAYEREAYLRLRVTFNQYNGNLRQGSRRLMGILYGRIDGYEIFEDSGEKRLMLSVDTPAQEQTSYLMSVPAVTAAIDDASLAHIEPASGEVQAEVATIKPKKDNATTFGAAPLPNGISNVSHSFAP